jgi:LacI family transcriptional regulator
MPNMNEVARLAKVSLGTVSNVLNHPEHVSDETRARVQRAIDALGFVRNGSARQLRTGSTQSIGLVVLDVSNPFFTEVARGAEAAANERGYLIILCNSENSRQREENYLRVLEEQRVAGILMVPVENDVAYTRSLLRSGTHLVLLDRVSQDATACSVSVDDVYGGELAAKHLLGLGHRRIAYIHGPFTSAQYVDRLAGLRRAVVDAGLVPDQAIVALPAGADNPQAGATCVEAFLQLKDRPTAIFCGNDNLAMGVLYELARQGVAVPDDIALIGYDDIDLAPMLSVPLTTIRQPKYDLGFAATGLLLDELDRKERHTHRQIVFRPELIVRLSTGIAAR